MPDNQIPEHFCQRIQEAKEKQLEELDLSNNWNTNDNKKLTKIPDEVFQLKKLKVLKLNYNKINNIPKSISNLSNLTYLSLNNNQITNIPKFISNLSDLMWLDLSNNQITNIPKFISNLSDLIELHLSNNQLKNIPESISNLSHLTRLVLSNNQITNIPESISNLSNSTNLYLRKNPLESPPLEVAEQGIKAIREYFRQLNQEGKDYIYEAKLLIVGEAGAGKTTLAKKIKNPNYKLDNNQESTKGIDIIQWNVPLDNEREFKVNIWDFGGQEIYHETHQFFLTKRSLYTLVADTRKEDTDFYYWLNVVELLSDNSPLLIVKNEKQDRQREINDRALRGQFDNLKETLATNLKTNRDLEDILTNIRHYISNLPHIGSALPKTWVKVRQALENDSRNYITLQEYLDICEENGFTIHKDKLQLSGYLHDLGVCLHFQDEEDSLLYKTVIIKPEWGTYAVYKLLDNKKVINNQGRFTRSDLRNIWHEEKYASMRGELLELMRKFQLCYKISESKDTFIAPQLLSDNQLEYPWDENNNLILRYSYPNFMPKGIVTRFIVVMHQWIYQQKYVWKSGVILNKDHTKAEVIEYYGKREIRIRVSGTDKRGFMSIIANELDKINNSYKRLKYQKLIPCNCEICQPIQNPHVYEFNKLIERISNEKHTIECGNPPYNTVQVLGLIDNAIDVNQLIKQNDNKSINFDGNIQQLILQLADKENNINMTKTNQYHSGSGNNIGRDQNITNIYNSQNLSQAAKDIKELLNQLSEEYPSKTPTEQMILSAKTIEQIENNPKLKQRIINALKEAGTTALEEAIEHPAAKILVAGVKGFIDT